MQATTRAFEMASRMKSPSLAEPPWGELTRGALTESRGLNRRILRSATNMKQSQN